MSFRHFRFQRYAVFSLLFGVLGVVALSLTHAATPTIAVEAENGTRAGGGATIVGSTGASNGSAVKFNSGSATNNCMPNPHLCGFPDATNTGVPAGTTLTAYTGPTTITTDGTVIDSKIINTGLDINAKNVIIKNCQINAGGVSENVSVSDTGSATIQDSELIGAAGAAISFSNWTALRLNIHDFTDDGVKLGSNTRLQDSYIHDFATKIGAHADGGQLQSGNSNIVVQHNTVYAVSPPHVPAYDGPTSAFIISNDEGPDTAANLTMTNNLLGGGSYTLDLGDGHGLYVVRNLTVSNNRFAGGYDYGHFDVADAEVPNITATGNIDDVTGAPLSLF